MVIPPSIHTLKKWRVAATSIQFITLLISLTKKTSIRMRWRQAFNTVRSNSRVLPENIVVIVDPPLQTTTVASFSITQPLLAAALENLDRLREFGDVDGVTTALCTHSHNGISGNYQDLLMRRKVFGSNNYQKIHSVLLINLVRTYMSRSCKDAVLYISFILSFGIRIYGHKNGVKEGGFMLLIAFLYSIFSSVIDFGVESYLGRLINLSTKRLFQYSSAFVIRSGSKHRILLTDIVVGDIIALQEGEIVPADGLLVDGNSLTVSELTSKSNDESEVNNAVNPFLFSGSRVITGSAKMVVTAVGTNTRLSKKQAGGTINKSTAVQDSVHNLMSVTKKVNLGVAWVVLVLMLARYFSGISKDEQGNPEFEGGETYFGDGLYMILRIILVSITIALAMDSESFLWIVKICQGSTIKKMAADGILVTEPSSLEKMGYVTSVLVTDRIGELTANQLGEFQEAGVQVIMVNAEDKFLGNGIQRESLDLVAEIQSLKQSGHIVALLTQDNDHNVDALALEEANVRIVVSSGTDDENQTHQRVKADIFDAIITNVHKFPSVIKLLISGRCIVDNTQKFIQFQLTAGAVSLLNSFIYTVSQTRTPTIDNRLVYSLIQLVWVNLVFALLVAIALSREQPHFKTRQVDKKDRLIYGSMWRNIVVQIVYQTVVIQAIQFKGESIFGLNDTQNDTMSFAVFFYCQVFNMFNARTVEDMNVVKRMGKNKVFMAIVGAIVVMQFVFVEVLHKVVDLEILEWNQRFQCLGLSFGSLLVSVVAKLVHVPY